eukprot:1247696-Rhodomonas_salina.1
MNFIAVEFGVDGSARVSQVSRTEAAVSIESKLYPGVPGYPGMHVGMRIANHRYFRCSGYLDTALHYRFLCLFLQKTDSKMDVSLCKIAKIHGVKRASPSNPAVSVDS